LPREKIRDCNSPYKCGRRDGVGTQIDPSCCSGVFVDQSAEPVASVQCVRRVRIDEA